MPKILEITHDKGKLYRIALEDEQTLWLHGDLLAAEHLKVGQPLSEDDIAYLQEQAALHRTYEYALYCLDRRSYSCKELADKLMSAKNPVESAVTQTIEKLVRLGFLDDARYAAELARTYIESRHYGLRKAAFEMKRRGLSRELIEDALAAYSEDEQIAEQLSELIAKKYARYLTDENDRKSIEKVTAALVRRGFDYADIRDAIRAWFEDES